MILSDINKRQFLMDGMAQLYRRQDLPQEDVLENLSLQQQRITVAGSLQLFREKIVFTKLIQERVNHHVNLMK